MAGELKHKSVGTELTQIEFEDVLLHQLEGQAVDDIIFASSSVQLSRLAVAASRIIAKLATGGLVAATPAEIKTLLALVAADLPDHGAAQHTNVTRELFIPCGMQYSGGVVHIQLRTGIALDAAVDEYAFIEPFKVPDDFVSFGSLKLVWGAEAGVAGADWRCNPYCNYSANNESVTQHTDNPVALTIDCPTANRIYVTDVGFTLANLAKGDYVGVYFNRDADHAEDTLAVDVVIVGLELSYVAEQ